jgi:hypothetical protein
MALDSTFIEAVKNGDKRRVRIRLANSITIDPTLQTFNEMKVYAEQQIHDLYDAHKGELNTARSAWTKDYYDKEQTELSFNFSRERLALLCEMAAYFYGDRIDAINENRRREESPEMSTATKAGIGLTAGGALAAGVGALVKVPVIVGLGIAAAVVGVVVLVSESGENK